MKVGILGAGAFGIALASILHRNNVYIEMWTHNEEERNVLDKDRVSSRLKNYNIPKDIVFTTDLESTIKDKDLIVMAMK